MYSVYKIIHYIFSYHRTHNFEKVDNDMINYINQDLTTITSGIVAHGVNCEGIMGAGVTKHIKEVWPTAFEEYTQECTKYSDKSALLGMVQISDVGISPNTLFVANCFTQESCSGPDKVQYASIEAIQEALENVVAVAEIKQLPVYIPRIGAGLGGLNWETDIKPVVEKIANDTNVTINVCILK